MLPQGEAGRDWSCSEKGFILPTTLFVLAAILIAVGWYGEWTSRMLHRAGNQKDFVQFELDSRSTLSMLLFQLYQGETSHRGMLLKEQPEANIASTGFQEEEPTRLELLFDDTCYEGIGDVEFSIQDEFGLIGVRLYGIGQLGPLLTLMGVPPEEQAALLDTLKDYQDPDDLHRLSGAEQRLYKQRNRKGPANAPFLNPMELYNVLGWDSRDDLWQNSEFSRLITMYSSGIPSLNTAPSLALQTVPAIDASLADILIAKRQEEGFASLSSIEAAIGQSLGLDPLGLGFYSGNYLRISLWQKNLKIMREIHIKLNQMSTQQPPWIIEYERIIARPTVDDSSSCKAVEEIFSD